MQVANITAGEGGGTPEAALLRKGSEEHVVPTSDGHSVTLKKPGVLAQFKLIEMLGPEAAANQTFVGMVLPLLYVAAIDGDAVPRFTTRRELDALIQRLDEPGVAAVMTNVQLLFSPPDPEAAKAAVKN